MKKISAVIILAALCTGLHAQSVPFMVRGTDPRFMATGAVGTENLAATNALSGKKLDAAASYGINLSDTATGIAGFNGYGNFGKLSVGLYGRYNMCAEYEMFNDRGRSLGAFKPSEMSVGASVAYKITDKLAAGVRASYISSKLSPDAAGSSVGIDVSAAYSNGALTAELAVRNLGQKIKYGDYEYALPSFAVAGVSYGTGGFKARAEAGYAFSGSFMAGLGAEYTFVKIVSLRAGFHYGDDTLVPTYASGGLGVQFAGVRLDATWCQPLGGGSGAILAGLGYSF